MKVTLPNDPGVRVKACVMFKHQGFEISISTFMGVYPELAIFGPTPGDGTIMPHEWTKLLMGENTPYGDAKNIANAVAAIDRYVLSCQGVKL